MEFAPGKSTNVGMMAMMKMKAKVRQTDDTLVVTRVAVFNGTEQNTENRVGSIGKSVENRTPMNAKAETVSHWEGARLVTTWTTGGPADSEKQTRTETRYLSSDGKTMTVGAPRENAPAMVMVYDRDTSTCIVQCSRTTSILLSAATSARWEIGLTSRPR